MNVTTNNSKIIIAACSLLIFGISCSGDNSTSVDNTEPINEEAILIAERFNTPDGRIVFMGVFPELPDEPIETSQLTELSPAGKAFSCGGNAFFHDADASSITKFIVEDDLSLTEAQTIQVSQEGIEGFTGAIVCASESRAYIFNLQATRGVEFNPEEMVIVDAFDLPAPDFSENVNPIIFEPSVSENLVYFPAAANNFSTIEYATKAAVGVFDLNDETWTYTYREGCASGTSGFIGPDGTFYRDGSFESFFRTYSEQNTRVPDCQLRIPAGEKQFDTDYKIELEPTNLVFSIDEQFALTLEIDPSVELPSRENMFDWFSLPVVPTRLNRETGEKSAYPGLPTVPPQNGRSLTIDGRRLFQINEFDDDGLITRTDVVELTPNGPTEPIFSIIGGDVLTLERLR